MKYPGYEPDLICAQSKCGSHYKWLRILEHSATNHTKGKSSNYIPHRMITDGVSV